MCACRSELGEFVDGRIVGRINRQPTRILASHRINDGMYGVFELVKSIPRFARFCIHGAQWLPPNDVSKVGLRDFSPKGVGNPKTFGMDVEEIVRPTFKVDPKNIPVESLTEQVASYIVRSGNDEIHSVQKWGSGKIERQPRKGDCL